MRKRLSCIATVAITTLFAVAACAGRSDDSSEAYVAVAERISGATRSGGALLLGAAHAEQRRWEAAER